jgi:cobalt-zinc-cadmium efflux system protein
MAHDHDHHGHSHGVTSADDMGNAFKISIALNLLYVIAEIIAGFMYNSMALLTDAGHNISDIASLLLSVAAFWLAKKRPTTRYTYGYKKTTILSALANAVILLIAVGVLGYETIRRFTEPYAVKGSVIAWVAALGIIVNSISAYLFFKGRKGDLNVKSAYLHLLADALVSFSVVVAGIIISYTGWYILDPVIGLVVLVVILIGTWRLLVDSFKLSVDAVPPGIHLQHIKNAIQQVADVVNVDHIHIWAISTTENSLTAHVQLNAALDFAGQLKVIKEIRHRLEHENIQHCTIEMEGSSAADAGCN